MKPHVAFCRVLVWVGIFAVTLAPATAQPVGALVTMQMSSLPPTR